MTLSTATGSDTLVIAIVTKFIGLTISKAELIMLWQKLSEGNIDRRRKLPMKERNTSGGY